MENNTYQKGDGQYFFKMFRFVKPYTIPYVFGTFLYNLQGFVMPLIISIFASGMMAAITFRDATLVMSTIITIIIMILVFMVAVGPGIYVMVMTEAKIVRDLKQRLFRAFVSNSLEGAGSTHSGEGIAAINTDADTAAEVYGNPLHQFLRCIITIVATSTVVFVVDIRIGAAAFAVGLLGFIVQSRFSKPLARIGKQRLATNAESVKVMSNIFSGATAIRAYNMQDKAAAAFEAENKILKALDFKEAFITMWRRFYTSVQGWLMLVVVFVLGGWLVYDRQLELYQLMMTPFLCLTIAESFGQIGAAYAGLQPPLAGAKRVFTILESGRPQTTAAKRGMSLNPLGHQLEIDNLNFKYMGAEDDMLKNITMTIPQNKMIAVVGSSGSGKSTLLRVLIGMYERDEMPIKLGNVQFCNDSITDWRRNFAYVDQSCKLFDMTIAENIAMGAGGNASQADIENAAKRAFAHDFIMEIEDGYNAPCGEKGGTLSGGQKQRIAIARALVKKAPILVFDEATSALDAESERSIMETIETLRKENTNTILMTTHNLENVVTADSIVVMEEGRVVEMGTHEELMARQGVYYRLYTN